jgi:hypothetical protein
MESENRLTKETIVNQRKRLAKSAVVLSEYFEKWKATFPTYEVSAFQMGVYAEALDDLTPEQLECGCREVTRIAETFPKPAHIRKAAERLLGDPATESMRITKEDCPMCRGTNWRLVYLPMTARQTKAYPPGYQGAIRCNHEVPAGFIARDPLDYAYKPKPGEDFCEAARGIPSKPRHPRYTVFKKRDPVSDVSTKET